MDRSYQGAPDVTVLPTHMQAPQGALPINAFVIKAAEPVLVDAGIGIDSEYFMEALAAAIDPQELRWLWLTHDDADHIGCIRQVLEAAPRARLATHAMSIMRLNSAWQVPMDRVLWLSPGDSIDVGDRRLTAVRPPVFDNPTTLGIFDDSSASLFAVDSFGAFLQQLTQNFDEIPAEELRRGMTTWTSADTPWVHQLDQGRFQQELDRIRQMSPKTIFSSHLPPARGALERLLEILAAVPVADPFIAPSQPVLEQMLAQQRRAG